MNWMLSELRHGRYDVFTRMNEMPDRALMHPDDVATMLNDHLWSSAGHYESDEVSTYIDGSSMKIVSDPTIRKGQADLYIGDKKVSTVTVGR